MLPDTLIKTSKLHLLAVGGALEIGNWDSILSREDVIWSRQALELWSLRCRSVITDNVFRIAEERVTWEKVSKD